MSKPHSVIHYRLVEDTMIRYETLFMTVPEITADEAAALEGSFEKLLAEHKASLLSFERWGKYRLAYPVRTNDYGVYFLTRFEISDAEKSKSLLDAMDTLMSVKYNELVMRHMNTRLGARSSLSYHRPESLEEAPSRDVETFLKKAK